MTTKSDQFPTYEQLQQGWLQMTAERDLLKAAIGVDLARIEDLEKALQRLVFAARTSGGIAGTDEFLCAACRNAEFVLRSAEEVAERCHKCGERTDTYPVGSYHKCADDISRGETT